MFNLTTFKIFITFLKATIDTSPSATFISCKNYAYKLESTTDYIKMYSIHWVYNIQ